jgi:hypothetical protein
MASMEAQVWISKGLTAKNFQTKDLRGIFGAWWRSRFGKWLKLKDFLAGTDAKCGFLKDLPLKMSKQMTYG